MEPTLASLTLDPARVTLTSADGSRPSQRFVLIGVRSDGTSAPIEGASFAFDSGIGTFDPMQGTLTANGRVGGEVELVAVAGSLSTAAQVRVDLLTTILDRGTSSAAPSLFATSIIDPDRAAAIAYPLDGAVMPRNLPPPLIQWTGGEAGDVLRVRLEAEHVRVTAYVTHSGSSFQDAYRLPIEAWRRVTLTARAVELAVDRFDRIAREAITGSPVRLRFAEAALEGSIYYREVDTARMMRIDLAGGSRTAFVEPPLGCLGCHSVSADGRYLAGRLGTVEEMGGVFDLTEDLTTTTAVAVFSVSERWWYSTFSPDGRRLLITTDELGAGGSALLDARTGERVEPTAGALPQGLVSHPTWAPDGSAIAFLANLDTWGGYNTTGDLFVLPSEGDDRFGVLELLVAGSSVAGDGAAITYPSWSPDSEHLAFAHGTSGLSGTGTSAVYLVGRRGGEVIALGRASVGGAFQPRFAPAAQGGYFWLCTLSRRAYGNAKAGTAATLRQHIWVSAIRSDPVPGEDPSEVGYWLPGQDLASPAIAAFWARRACRNEGEPCEGDGQCCSSDCSGTCAPPGPPGAIGAPCRENADCLDARLCIDGTCGGIGATESR
jgi:hypothetical protein